MPVFCCIIVSKAATFVTRHNQHMKKTILFITTLAFAILGASVASAQEVTVSAVDANGNEVEVKAQVRPMDASAKREALKAEIELKKGELKDRKATSSRAEMKAKATSTRADMKAQASSTRAEIKEKAADRVATTISKATEQLNEAILRLEEHAAKIDSRLDKFEAEGGVTTAPRAELASAELKITAAKTAVSAIASVEVSSTSPKTTIDSVKKAARDAQKSIQEAKQALMKAIPAMKGIEASIKKSKSPKEQSTTTATTTATTSQSN
jgi:hypothetical protein